MTPQTPSLNNECIREKNQDMVFDVCARMDKENDKQKKRGGEAKDRREYEGNMSITYTRRWQKKKEGGNCRYHSRFVAVVFLPSHHITLN